MSAAAILKLHASGFSAEQVSALAELVDTQAATKADVETASHKLDQKIDAVEHRLELKIGELKSHVEATEHRLELKIEGLDRKITETNSNTLKWVIGAIGFQTLVLIGTIIGALSALLRFIPTTPIVHQ